MELCIFISNIYHLKNLEETLKIIQKPDTGYIEIMNQDLQVNQTALVKLKKHFDLNLGYYYLDYIERIYFGVETCEHLLPSKEELQEAYAFCKEKEYGFTFVTPYGGPQLMKNIRPLFDFLAEKDNVEVVVNDYGTLQILISEYKMLTPVIGRLLNKMKRDPRFSTSGYDIASANIKNKSKVEKNQVGALQNNSYENASLQKFLVDKNVSRLGTDAVPQGFNKKNLKKWMFPLDLYWPWTYITSGRNCAVASYTDSSMEFHVTDKPCQKQCKLYGFTFESDKKMKLTLQRGNAIWMNSESDSNELFNQGFERLVFTPYIPI
jgi:hypothetical protein